MQKCNWHKIRSHFWADDKTYKLIQDLFPWQQVSPGTYQVYTDLMVRSAWRDRIDEEFGNVINYPLYSGWLKANGASGKDITALVEAGILATDNLYYFNKEESKCKHFWIPEYILQEFEAKAFFAKSRVVNIFTGKKYKPKEGRNKPMARQSVSVYENGNLKASKLIVDAIAAISKPVEVNVGALRNYATRLLRWQSRWEAQGKTINKKKRFASRCNQACRLAIYLGQDSIGEFAHYIPQFSHCYTGRISELANGLQSSANVIKKLLLRDIKHANLDLKASQLHGLNYFTNSAELLSVINNIYPAAATLGIPKAIVKAAVFGTMFNCGQTNKGVLELEAYTKKHRIPFEAINQFLRVIAKECVKAIDIFKGKFDQHYQNHAGKKLTVGELVDMAYEDWQEFEAKHKKRAQHIVNKKEFVDHAINKKLLAFYIQGLEAYIIHSLTVAGADNGYTVISNQHDGIIVVGEYQNAYKELESINNTLEYKFELENKPL